MPTNDVCAANLSGAYKCRKYGVVSVVVIQWTGTNTFKIYNAKFTFQPSNVGQVFVLDECGNYGRSGAVLINMNTAIKQGYLQKYY